MIFFLMFRYRLSYFTIVTKSLSYMRIPWKIKMHEVSDVYYIGHYNSWVCLKEISLFLETILR